MLFLDKKRLVMIIDRISSFSLIFYNGLNCENGLHFAFWMDMICIGRNLSSVLKSCTADYFLNRSTVSTSISMSLSVLHNCITRINHLDAEYIYEYDITSNIQKNYKVIPVRFRFASNFCIKMNNLLSSYYIIVTV